MWLFSSSADAPATTTTANTPVDEESTMDTPQKSNSAVHDDNNGVNASQEMNDDAASNGKHNDCDTTKGGPPNNIPPIRHSKNGESNIHTQVTATTKKKQKGIIYFRQISPSDRTVIQTLHEHWFPVDYKTDFFDTLCNREDMKIMSGFPTEPLYCQVACFRELCDEEFEDRMRRRKGEREGRMRSGWSFWSGGGNYENESGVENDEYDDDDCILWEMDDSIEDDGSDSNGISSYQAATNGNNNTQSQHHPQRKASSTSDDGANSNNSDDVIESGESALSMHHRRERERMKRFYTNGFCFDDSNDDDDESPWCSNGERNFNNSNTSSSRSSNDDNSNNNTEKGPYYNDAGERIVGCIVGSFLPSNMPANKQINNSDEKHGGRDETAQLLVPDANTHNKMFYIMTLGTTREVRRCGLGSVLVNRVVDMIEEREEVGALYLHVIIYNECAIRLYERLGFARVKEIKDYYTINAVNYDCYLYARYFHGNHGHNKTTFDIIYDLATSIIRKLSSALIST